MATMLMTVEEPQPRTLRLASITLIFDLQFSEDDAQALAEQYIGLISDELGQLDKIYGFSIGDEVIQIDDLYLEFDSVEQGSIKVNFLLVGTFVLGAYNAVATYPDFKDGFQELKTDIELVLGSAVDREPSDWPNPHKPVGIEVLRKEEDEILAEIAESR